MYSQRCRVAISTMVLFSLVVLPATAQWGGNPVVRARCFFEMLPPGEAGQQLGTMRPQPVSPEHRERVRAGLPPEGELRPDSREASKLASLKSVLKYHQREDVYDLNLIDVPQAAVGFHARTVLLISRNALRLLAVPELQALVAHEVGHEFFWDEYEQARQRRDEEVLREVELKCDGIATLTLRSLGLDPLSLVRGARKLNHFNEALGATANRGSYPTLSERDRFVRELAARRTAAATRLKRLPSDSCRFSEPRAPF
jgi:hypothetical protein